MGSGVFYRSVKPVLNAFEVDIPELKSLDERPGFLQSSREDLRRTRRILKKAVRDKGGPIRVMVMCEQGHIDGFSNEVAVLFESYLKARKLDSYFKTEHYGFLKTPKQIRAELETVEETRFGLFGYRKRRPDERVDFIVPLYQDRPPNIESALTTCNEPKPVLLHNPFPDDINAKYKPKHYLKLLTEILEHTSRNKGRDSMNKEGFVIVPH